MKRFVTLAAAAALGIALAVPALAQEGGAAPGGMAPPPTAYGRHHPYVRGFDGYLDKHPDVAQELSRNPRLIDDPKYLANHPELRDYVRDHPRMARAFRRHPDRFMRREHAYDRGENRWDRAHHRPNSN